MRVLVIGLVTLSMAVAGCESMGERTAKGAGIGAAAGAVAGAVIGHQSGNRGKGAAIGAVAGGLLGGAVGKKLDQQAKELAEVAETKRTEEGILTRLKNDILFSTGSAALKPEAKGDLQKIASILKKYPENQIVVIGHTDSTGSADLNQRLSEQRAQAVKIELIKAGVNPNKVQVIGMGPSQPVAANNTETGRAQNRRVELQITMPSTAKSS